MTEREPFTPTVGPRPLRTEVGEVRSWDSSIERTKSQCWEAVETVQGEKGYRPDRTRQKVVFDRIHWETFYEELFEGIGETESIGAGRMMRGKLFEMLINADPEFGERTPLEKELLDLAHNPEKYHLEKELGYHRNPDMAFLLLQKANGVEIVGVGESKLGLLNERSYKQLSETGFRRGVTALVDVVNTLSNPEAYGLSEVAKARKALGEGKHLLTVASAFSQLLVVPANRNVEWKSSLLNRREFTATGRQEFYDLLEHHVTVKRAAFSTAEVTALTHHAIRTWHARKRL